jgi:hypothetical protein
MIPPFIAFAAIMLAAVVTVSGGFLSGTYEVADTRAQFADRAAELTGTHVEIISVTYVSPQIDVVLRNTGRVSLRDSPSWDVWASFHEATTYHPERLAYTTASMPANDQWTVDGIYLDAASSKAESSQPGILDPSEEMKLLLRLNPAPADPQANFATVGLPNGATVKFASTWESLATGPASVGTGGSLAGDGTYVYALAGGGQVEFWRFKLASGTWDQMADAPAAVREGGALAYALDGSTPYIYGLRGGGTNDFWRYDISANTWSSMTVAPEVVSNGGALAWGGANRIYAFRGGAQ